MQLETQSPNELGSLIDWNLIPKLGVGSSFRFLFALPKYPDRSVGSRIGYATRTLIGTVKAVVHV